MPEVLSVLHDALAGQGIDKARIKTRGIKLDHAVVGEKGADGVMAHTTLLLLEGRDGATRKAYGQALYDAMQEQIGQVVAVCKLTLEVRDMVKETYFQ